MKKSTNLISFLEWKKEQIKDPWFKREYDKLEPEFQIAKQMIDARIKQNLTQAQLAKKAKTGQAVIFRLEGMNAKPSLSLLSKIASALNTEINVVIKPV